MAEKIGVLVVDDSAFMRKIITQIINDSGDFYVVDLARDGQDALNKLTQHGNQIQLVTLDIQMPGMDGLACLQHIMQEHPRRVIMVSSLTTSGARETLAALEYGAIDFLAKPGGAISLTFETVGPQLIQILRTATKCSLPRVGAKTVIQPPPKPVAKPVPPAAGAIIKGTQRLVAVASSTGGPKALAAFLPNLPGNLRAAVLVVQHMPMTFTKLLAERLDRVSQITIREAEAGDVLRPGVCLIAPGAYHLEIDHEEKVKLTKDPPITGLRPCADITFKTVASVFGSRALGVVLTGMGRDGTEGCRALRAHGCKILVESKQTALIYGMPKSVVDSNLHDRELPIDAMAQGVVDALER